MKTTVGHAQSTHVLQLCSASAHCSQFDPLSLSCSCARVRQRFGACTMPMGCYGQNTTMTAPCDRITTKPQQVLTRTCNSVRTFPWEDIRHALRDAHCVTQVGPSGPLLSPRVARVPRSPRMQTSCQRKWKRATLQSLLSPRTTS